MITYESTKLPNKFPVKYKTGFMRKNVLFIIANVQRKDVRTIILARQSDVMKSEVKTITS